MPHRFQLSLILFPMGLVLGFANPCFAASASALRTPPARVTAYFAQTFRCPDGQRAIVLQRKAAAPESATPSDLIIECGDIRLGADAAVVWVNRIVNPQQSARVYHLTVFLQGQPRIVPDNLEATTPPDLPDVRIVTFETVGQVFLTAETLIEKPGLDLPIYQLASRFQPGLAPAASETAAPEAPAPKLGTPTPEEGKAPQPEIPGKPTKQPQAETPAPSPAPAAGKAPEKKPAAPSKTTPALVPAMQPAPPGEPVHISYQGLVSSRRFPDGSDVFTCTDGIYIYQQRPKENALLELRAQNAVVFYSQKQIKQGAKELGEAVEGVYLEGDVNFQFGDYHATADKVYYDFVHQSALILDGALKMLVPDSQNMPIFVRAERIRQLSQNHFAAKKVKLSTDEFYKPHVWSGASEADIVAIDEEGNPAESTDQVKQYNYDLRDFTGNLGDLPVLWLPRVAGASSNPNAPIRTVRASSSSHFGVGVETEWDLPGLLGRPKPKGVDAVFRLDEFTKRGPAAGVDVDYKNPRYFGDLRTYYVHDDGDDFLGDFPARKNVPPSQQDRGQARWRHRQYLPYDWQATFEVSYLSDPTFLESWDEKQFDAEKEQETLVYLKQQRDNWAFDFLTKYHLNDFEYTQTKLPASSFHLAGQDLFQTLTYYQDSSIARISEKAGDRDVPGLSGKLEPWLLPGQLTEDDSALGISRNELALPMHFGQFNVAPTFIGTYAYDDSMTSLTGGSALQDAAGVRASTQFWHVDNSAQSRLWNIDRIRHVVAPEASAFWIDSDIDDQNDQDVFNFGVRQRWQTYRGAENKKTSTDFLRWNNSVTLVNHDVDGAPMPNNFFFSTPEPQFDKGQILNPDFFNLGLARREIINQTFSDFATTDWTWEISDTTDLFGGLNYNIHDGDISETDAGIAVQRSPRASYYIGHQFIKNADTFKNANMDMLTTGASYQLNRKYIVAVGEQFDIERASSAYTQFLIIRKFPHWYGAFCVTMNPLRDEFGVSVSFWPEGLDKVALGSRRFSRLAP
jgi:hypothetical protein